MKDKHDRNDQPEQARFRYAILLKQEVKAWGDDRREALDKAANLALMQRCEKDYGIGSEWYDYDIQPVRIRKAL